MGREEGIASSTYTAARSALAPLAKAGKLTVLEGTSLGLLFDVDPEGRC